MEDNIQEVETEKEAEEEHFNVIDFFELSKEEYEEDQVAAKIQNKLGTSLEQMKEVLSKSVIDRAEELTLDFVNIAPMGDYDKLLEDNDSMAEFLKMEAHKLEHWKLYKIFVSDVNKDLLSFVFKNIAVDDGENFEGFVFVTKTGKIKHGFARIET
jgi:dsDNA-binding SOS-regulon protein